MITERREIGFEAETLMTVLAGSPKAAAAFGLAGGQPKAVLFDTKAKAVRFVFSGSGDHTHSVSLDATRLAALLVGFCMRMRIPLPRKAEKTIRVEPGVVVLAFRTSVQPNLAALLPEGHPAESEPTRRKPWGNG